MPIIKQTESTFLPVPAGTHVSRCYSMVSIGTQKSLNPQYTPKFQVILFFEIPGETITVGGETRPMVISEWLNCYLGSATKPSKTRTLIESWRGRPFSEQELAGFNIANVVGAPCLLNVMHEVKAGKSREKIASITPLPKGMVCPPQFHKSVVYEIEQGRDAVFQALPPWVQKKIEACEEWNHTPAADEPATVAEDNKGDDIPF